MKIEISYCYPTSKNAELFNFEKEGCYTVTFISALNPKNEPIRAFATLEEAKKFSTLGSFKGFEFSKYSL